MPASRLLRRSTLAEITVHSALGLGVIGLVLAIVRVRRLGRVEV